jgi:hypothetical protein
LFDAPLLESLYGRKMAERALRDAVIVDGEIVALGGFQFERGGKAYLSDQIGDTAIETLDHAIALRMPGRR